MPLTALVADHESIVRPCSGYTAGMVVFPLPDRRTAGRLLAGKLKDLCSEQTVVLALPRGGVPVASEITKATGATLDVIVTRKIGFPRQPELGVGAIAEGMRDPVYDDRMLARLGITPADLASVVAAERAELARRVLVYRPGRPPPDVAGRPVIVVDDGLATGVTARAALRSLRAGTFGSGAPGALLLAVPVAPPAAAEELGADADRVVTLVTPRRFASVGEWYESFPQLTDADVLELLGPHEVLPRGGAGAPLPPRQNGSRQSRHACHQSGLACHQSGPACHQSGTRFARIYPFCACLDW
jgi:putative phosphoribosyl transferase